MQEQEQEQEQESEREREREREREKQTEMASGNGMPGLKYTQRFDTRASNSAKRMVRRLLRSHTYTYTDTQQLTGPL